MLMMNELTYRDYIINEIETIKAEAIIKGFDFPSESYKSVTDTTLESFLNEIRVFVSINLE